MEREPRQFLENLLMTPSPTGFEEAIQQVVRDRMGRYADVMHTDLHGNLIVGLNPDAPRKVMLAGHCDQIALMVQNITEDGFIYVSALGGIDVATLYGAKVSILGYKKTIDGVIGRMPIHLQSDEERGKGPKDIKDIWIDVGVKSGKELEKSIEIGDPIVFRPEVGYLGKDFVTAPGLDNRVGLFVAMETLRRCVNKKLAVGLFAVSTVQEEVGLRGAKTAAFSIAPEVGIAIDVTHASDNPGGKDRKKVGCALGAGPCISKGPNTNPVVMQMLRKSADISKVKYQLDPAPRPLGNDANVIQVNRGGVATASIGIPNRYMHTQAEVCSLSDIDNASKLLAHFIASISGKTDFTPSV